MSKLSRFYHEHIEGRPGEAAAKAGLGVAITAAGALLQSRFNSVVSSRLGSAAPLAEQEVDALLHAFERWLADRLS